MFFFNHLPEEVAGRHLACDPGLFAGGFDCKEEQIFETGAARSGYPAIGEFRTKAVGIAVLLLAMAAGALVYRDRLRYEYEKGLDEYLAYIHENFDEEEDAIIYADLHSNFLSIFAPEYYTYIFGYEDDFNPYDNDEVFTKAEQMEQVKGSLYFICLNDKNPDWFMKSDYEQVYGFHYLVYDFSVYRILEIH